MRFLADITFVKRAIGYLLAGTMLFILAANIYVGVHYYNVMPRFPEPQTGRIYRRMVAFGVRVYVNKQEMDLLDLLNHGIVVCGIGVVVLGYLKTHLKWF